MNHCTDDKGNVVLYLRCGGVIGIWKEEAIELRDWLLMVYPISPATPVFSGMSVDELHKRLLTESHYSNVIGRIMNEFRQSNNIPKPIELKWTDIGDISVCLWKDIEGVEQTASVIRCCNRPDFIYKINCGESYKGHLPMLRADAKEACEAEIRKQLA